MPKRIVDDPITLPEGMARAMFRPWMRFAADDKVRKDVNLNFTYAITNRLEYTDLLSLRYAFADDAPVVEGQRPPQKFSLSLLGGLVAFGYSSVDGWIFGPKLQLQLRKRYGQDTYLYAQVTPWSIVATRSTRSDGTLDGEVGSVTQITETSALRSGVHILQSWRCGGGCVTPQVSGALSVQWMLRPRHWFEYGLGLTAAKRLMHKSGDDYQPPAAPLFMPTIHSAWIMASLSASFYW